MENNCKRGILFLAIFLFFLASFIFPRLIYSTLSASNSTVSVDHTSVSANGSDTAKITVTLLDNASPPGPINTHRVELSLAGMTDSNLVINGGSKGSSILAIRTGNSGNAANVATFTISSATVQTDKFNIRDVDENIALGQANVSFTTPSCGDAVPKAPTLSEAVSQSSSEIKLTWTAVAEPFSYYVVSYGVSSGSYIYGNPNVGKQNNYIVGSLSPGVTYYFVVKAMNGCGASAYSNEVAQAAGRISTPSLTPALTPTPTRIASLSPTLTPTITGSLSGNIKSQVGSEKITTAQSNMPVQIQEIQAPTPPQKTLVANSMTNQLGILAIFWVFGFILGNLFFYFYLKKIRSKTPKPTEKVEPLKTK